MVQILNEKYKSNVFCPKICQMTTAKFLRKVGKCLQICVILRFGLNSRHVTPQL